MKNITQIFNKNIGILMAVLCLASCTENDKDDNGDLDIPVDDAPTSILGTWRWDNPYYDIIYHCDKDGEGVLFEGNSRQRYKYTYDKNDNIVELEFSEHHSEKLPVKFLKSNSLMIDEHIFKSTSLTYKNLILGTWGLIINKIVNNEQKQSISWVRVRNKEFLFKDDVDNNKYYHSWFGEDDVKTGEYFIEGDIITFTGDSDISGKYIIKELDINSCRLIRTETENDFPYIIGEWKGL